MNNIGNWLSIPKVGYFLWFLSRSIYLTVYGGGYANHCNGKIIGKEVIPSFHDFKKLKRHLSKVWPRSFPPRYYTCLPFTQSHTLFLNHPLRKWYLNLCRSQLRCLGGYSCPAITSRKTSCWNPLKSLYPLFFSALFLLFFCQSAQNSLNLPENQPITLLSYLLIFYFKIILIIIYYLVKFIISFHWGPSQQLFYYT